MEEDKVNSTLIFGVFDGHGEAGDLVSHYFTERIAQRLEKNTKYLSDPGAAIKEELEKSPELLELINKALKPISFSLW